MEFVIKLYADRTQYWLNVYNLFDFALIIIAYIDMSLMIVHTKYVQPSFFFFFCLLCLVFIF